MYTNRYIKSAQGDHPRHHVFYPIINKDYLTRKIGFQQYLFQGTSVCLFLVQGPWLTDLLMVAAIIQFFCPAR